MPTTEQFVLSRMGAPYRPTTHKGHKGRPLSIFTHRDARKEINLTPGTK
ncbi:hypothetical protein [Deinococcus peraridilitoris]|nr:hypothetical protein [Deinococcus peraridilitoris]